MGIVTRNNSFGKAINKLEQLILYSPSIPPLVFFSFVVVKEL